jgi:hypothetical protein
MDEMDLAEANATLDSWRLSSAELDVMNGLISGIVKMLDKQLGARARPVMVNWLGCALAHNLLRRDGVCVMQAVNVYLSAVAKSHGGVPMRLTMVDDDDLDDAA